MNDFLSDFERFMPSAWFSRGIEDRSETNELERRSRSFGSPRQPISSKFAIFAAATAVGAILSISTTITTTHVVVSEEKAETLASVAFDVGGTVSPGHWRRLGERLKAANVLPEDEAADIESAF